MHSMRDTMSCPLVCCFETRWHTNVQYRGSVACVEYSYQRTADDASSSQAERLATLLISLFVATVWGAAHQQRTHPHIVTYTLHTHRLSHMYIPEHSITPLHG